jgi:hypothetical protein
MAITAKWYLKGARELAKAGANLEAHTIKYAVLDNTHVPNTDVHDFFADVSADEIVDADYTAGGETLTVAVNEDTANDEVEYDAPNPTWPGPVTGAFGCIYRDTGNTATSPLLILHDLGGDQTFSEINFAAEGFAKLAAPVS